MASISSTLTAVGQTSQYLLLRNNEVCRLSVSRTGSGVWSADFVYAKGQAATNVILIANFTSTQTDYEYRNTSGDTQYVAVQSRVLANGASIGVTIADVVGDQILQDWRAADGTLAFRITDQGAVGGQAGGTLNVKAFGAVGDGVTDDTAAIQAAIDAAGYGDVVFFPSPAVRYLISGPLSVGSGVTVLGTGTACEVRTSAWGAGQMVFDLLDADDARVQGFRLTYVGARTPIAGSYRGETAYAASAGVYSNASHVTVRDVHVEGLAMGVSLYAWNGADLSGTPTGNIVEACTFDTVNHGLLFQGQNALRVHGLSATNLEDSSGGGNPCHAVYSTAGVTRNTDIVVSDCIGIVGAGTMGYGFQFKNVTGGSVRGLVAQGSQGLMNCISVEDVVFSDLEGRGLKLVAASDVGALTFQDGDTDCMRNTVRGVRISTSTATNMRLATLQGNDSLFCDLDMRTDRSNGGSPSELYLVLVWGDNVVVDTVALTCTGDAARGVGVITLDGKGDGISVRQVRGVNVRSLVETPAPAPTNAVVVINSAETSPAVSGWVRPVVDSGGASPTITDLATRVSTFGDGDTTPSVGVGGTSFATANGGPCTITAFDNGWDGMAIRVLVDANTTIQNNAAIKLAGAANFVGSANDVVSLVRVGGVWYETARSVN